jgi:hypothetical protein
MMVLAAIVAVAASAVTTTTMTMTARPMAGLSVLRDGMHPRIGRGPGPMTTHNDRVENDPDVHHLQLLSLLTNLLLLHLLPFELRHRNENEENEAGSK